RLIARVVQSQDRWRDQDRRRMEDVAELPGPIFRRVAILILVVDVDAPDEVDDLVVLEASREAEEGRRDGAVSLGEWLDASADLRIDRPVRGRDRTQRLTGLPDHCRGERNPTAGHRHQALP